jgi:hypothetical protein
MVQYFDGQLDELMDDPHKALVSKTTNWAYEKEWRLALQPDEADKVLPGGPDPVHLFDLPPNCITRIVIGYKAEADFVENLKTLVAKKIPHAKIQKLVVNRFAGTFSEEDI